MIIVIGFDVSSHDTIIKYTNVNVVAVSLTTLV
jgi:hypothetical protein